MHKSGFVNIIGNPNVGKSTLLNALVGERMSIITAKPQTTRHRIIGICNSQDYQIVFSDTPGVIEDPSYKMQEVMNKYVYSCFEDADIILFMTTPEDKYQDQKLMKELKKSDIPRVLILNKSDLANQEMIARNIEYWKSLINFDAYFPVSALYKTGTKKVFEFILENLPEGPPYYPKDQFTDRPERFFVSEIIREKILELYRQEIPYSVEVVVESFNETESKGKELVKLFCVIYVARKTQKSIVIGKKAESIKKLGILSRQAIEKFLEKKVYLELYVKVKENWRNSEHSIKQFGYN